MSIKLPSLAIKTSTTLSAETHWILQNRRETLGIPIARSLDLAVRLAEQMGWPSVPTKKVRARGE